MSTESPATASIRRTVKGCGRPSNRQLLWSLAFAVSLILGEAVLHYLTVPAAVRYLVPVVPLLAGLLFVRALVHDIQRQKDELQLRVLLEAAAVVVCGLFIVMLTYPILEGARLVGPLNHLFVEVLIAVLLVIGYLSARRRYR
jgi:hypothetical protein